MNLSIPTLVASIVLSSLVLSLAIATVAYRRNRVMWMWAWALALHALAIALFPQRGPLGNLLSVVLANTLVAIGFAMFTQGAYDLQQRVFPRTLLAWMPISVAVIGFYSLRDSLAGAQLLGGILFGLQSLLVVLAMVQYRGKTVGRGQYLLMLGFALLALVCLGQTTATLVDWGGGMQAMDSGLVLFAGYLISTVAFILLATGLPLMVYERAHHGLAAANQKLAELNITDSLTGLANRQRLDAFLATEWARARRTAQPIAMLMIDVDFFRKFNDHYGHQAGDDCLVQIAGVLRAGARRPSDLVARFAGEEFVVVAANTTLTQASELAELLRLAVAALAIPHFESSHDKVTISVGIAAMVPQEEQGREVLLKQAQAALGRVQNNNGNCVGES